MAEKLIPKGKTPENKPLEPTAVQLARLRDTMPSVESKAEGFDRRKFSRNFGIEIGHKHPEDFPFGVIITKHNESFNHDETKFLEKVPGLELYARRLQEVPGSLTNMREINAKLLRTVPDTLTGLQGIVADLVTQLPPTLKNLRDAVISKTATIDFADFPKLEMYNSEKVEAIMRRIGAKSRDQVFIDKGVPRLKNSN